MKLDNINFQEIMDDFFKKLQEAETEAVKQGIKNNTILLNGNHDRAKQFYLGFHTRISEFPPMLLGKKLFCVDFLPDEYDFALTWSDVKSSNDRIHELEDLFRKYVKCDGQSLRFKGLSYKKNIEDFEKIKELLK